MYAKLKTMSLADPVHVDSLPIRVSAIKDLDVIAGLDRGCSLTKIAFLPKDTSLDDAEFVSLRCLTFLNANFEDALQTMRDQAQLPASGKLHCTGVGGDIYKEKIKRIVGLDIATVPEHFTISPGCYLTVANSKPENIFHPPPPHKKWNLKNEKIDELFDAFQGNAEKSEINPADMFPAVIIYIGSGAAMFHADEQGKFTFGVSAYCGKTFIALANLLLGTVDYNEIMELAAAGNRNNVCQTVGDITDNQDLSTMGHIPFDMPVFAFGKAALSTFDRSKMSRADLAASLVGFYANGIHAEASIMCAARKTFRVYIAGNFARAEVVRSQIMECNTRLPPFLDIRFFATGHTGVIGAMMLKEDESLAQWVQPQ